MAQANMRQNFGGRLVLGKTPMPNKYRAIKTTVDNIRFDSKREAERYMGLKNLLRAGEISNLRLQVPYPIIINDFKVCTYIADFVYFDNATGEEVTEDSKGMKTAVYVLKKKLVKAVYGVEIQEV
jgi:hypothetical protein